MASGRSSESSVSSSLDGFFLPKAIAVIGATDREGSVGRAVLWNLLRAPTQARIYLVNPKRAELLGKISYKSVKTLPEAADLAVVATPAETVPGVVGDCVDAGVKAIVVISAGFREKGPRGAELSGKSTSSSAAGARG